MKIPKTMTKKKILIPVIVIFFIICANYALGEMKKTGVANSEDKKRADAITIDSMKLMGCLEKPAVVFLHDKHTDIKKDNLDCKTCHKKIKDRLLSKFMRLEDTSRQKVMDIYHDNCIGCHNETAAEGKKSGPLVCAECHRKTPKTVSSRQPMGFDKSLHYRHSEAYDKKCETCHADCITEKHEKGNETTCRHCHKKTASELNKVSLKLAVHASCIDCHLKKQAENKVAGPKKCYGCHDLESQKKIKKIFPVPRMDRKQPDTVILATGDQMIDAPGKSRMNLVPFDHSIHEQKNNTCRVCHHADLNRCNKCHVLQGSKEGKNVTLEMAMHSNTSQASCIGCHDQQKKEKKCAGCHTFIHKGQQKSDESCNKCHRNTPPQTKEKIIYPDTYNNLPETIEIKLLADKYEAARFPHRMIVETIVSDIEDNRLVNYFHKNKETLCKGCHHNSPASATPPKCSSCHNKTVNEKDLFKPGLMGAYHIQCMDCHQNMGIEKLGCTDCHKKNKKLR